MQAFEHTGKPIKTIAFTGKLANFTRNEAFAAAIKAGFSPVESVTECFTDCLVVADPSSSSNKVKKAKKYGVEVISEDDFIEMCNLDKKKVEQDARAKAEHKVKRDFSWAKCCKKLCEKLGIFYKVQTSMSADFTKRYYLVEIFLYKSQQFSSRLASSDSYIWLNSKQHDRNHHSYLATSREEAFKSAIKDLFQKEIPRHLDGNPDVLEVLKKIPNDNGFNTPSQLKMYLEIVGLSII